MNKTAKTDLSSIIEEQLPAAVMGFIRGAGELAEKEQQRLYLVGGVVRDLLLDRVNLDFDLVIEGDALGFAKKLAKANKATLKTHPRFGTATLNWRNHNIDVVTARRETYARPGALPRVQPGPISDDLARRDFSINAMAIELNPKHFGELLDPHGGQSDLKARLVKVLNDQSFIDDATRIWRAIRYEQRLDFQINKHTLQLLKKGLPMLDTISGTRLRHELERTFEEEYPEKALRRTDELGVLRQLHPSLKGDSWLEETFVLTRERYTLEQPPPQMYLALLAYRLTSKETEQISAYLKLPRQSSRILEDIQAVKTLIKELATPGMAPSKIYDLLHGRSLVALNACYLATDVSTAAENIELYLNVLRNIQPSLSGKDLISLGIPEGPRVKKVLLALREARLDGRIDSRREEEKMVEDWLKNNS
jgi:tRNA nucleotidyltransferase (CCA-adding enzyme)